jgi:hypothetical protein
VWPDAYLIVAAGRALYAPMLAEIAECAIEARDPIELLRARTRKGRRPLGREQFGRFVRLLTAALVDNDDSRE